MSSSAKMELGPRKEMSFTWLKYEVSILIAAILGGFILRNAIVPVSIEKVE